ncbi:MAG: outer membrane beta-barrel protein [Sphingomonas fennica]
MTPRTRRLAFALAAASSAGAAAAQSVDSTSGGALTLPDRTNVGGPPLSTVSPRLPRVGDGGGTLVPSPTPASAGRGVTVMNRSRPAYDPVGLRSGGFLILPEVSLRTTYTSNVFNQPQAKSDVFGRLRGAIAARSTWSRHALQAEGYVDQRTFVRSPTEDGLTYNAGLAGRLDVTRQGTIDAGGQISRVIVQRGATTEVLATRRPIRYDLRAGNIGVNFASGRFAWSLAGTATQFDYENAETPAGLPLDQQFRDFTLYDATALVAYGSPGGASIFVSARHEWRRFRLVVGPDRDADGIELLTGLRGDITPLIRGRLGVGYLRSKFKDPQFQTRGGLAFDARLDYLVTNLTTLNLSARRQFTNVSSINAPAALTTSVTVGADHELLPNLILSPTLSAQNADYVESPLVVRRYSVEFGAAYLVDRRFRLDGNVSYGKRTENRSVNSRAFDEVNVTAGISYRL